MTRSRVDLVLIPGGTIVLRDARTDSSREVRLRPFALATTTVTVEGGDGPMHPVTWFEAVRWCNRASLADGLTPGVGVAELEGGHPPAEEDVLPDERGVEPVGLPGPRDRLLARLRPRSAEDRLERIAGCAEGEEHDGGDHPDHQHRRPEPGQCPACHPHGPGQSTSCASTNVGVATVPSVRTPDTPRVRKWFCWS